MNVIEKTGLLSDELLVPVRLAVARGLAWAAKHVAPVALSGVGEHPDHGILGHVLVVGDDGLGVCAALVMAADKVREAVERSESRRGERNLDDDLDDDLDEL